MRMFYSAELGYMPLFVLMIFLLILCGIGIYGWWKSGRSEEDFYLAGRRQGLFVTVLTIMATFFSSSAMLAIPGNVYKDGVVFTIFALNLPVAGVAVYLIGARVWKLGRSKGYITQGDMISDHYGGSGAVRFLVALLGFLYLLPYIVMQIRAGGLMTEALFNGSGSFAGLDVYTCGAVGMTTALALYIIVGGMRSVALADAIQGSLLLVGMLVAGYTVVHALGGPAAYCDAIAKLPDSALTFPGYTGRYAMTALWTVCFFGAIASMVQPAQWMRYYSAKSAETLKQSMVIFATVLPLCLLGGVMLVGLGARVLYPPKLVDYSPEEVAEIRTVESGQKKPEEISLTQQRLDDYRRSDAVPADSGKRFVPHEKVGKTDQALVAVLLRHAADVFGGSGSLIVSLILIAILAASMSTADANLHALSAVVTRDIYSRLRPKAGDRERTWCNRAVVVLAAALSLTLVLIGEKSHEFAPLKMIMELQFVAIAFACQLIPVIIDTLFLRRGTSKGAIAGMLTGLAVVLCFTPILTLLLNRTAGPAVADDALRNITTLKSLFDPGFCGLIPNVCVFAAVSWLTRKQADKPQNV